VAKSKKRNSKNSMREAFPENPPKTLVYDALGTFNRDFEQVLDDLGAAGSVALIPASLAA
jgi:hypothetical protein